MVVCGGGFLGVGVGRVLVVVAALAVALPFIFSSFGSAKNSWKLGQIEGI